MGQPVTDQDYADVQRLHAQGLGRNAICKQLGRSGRTVSRIAAELGLSFDRAGATAVATKVKKANAAERRAEIQVGALEAAQKLLGQMFSPAKVYNFGGKENTYEEMGHNEPPFRDKRDIASAISALAATALKLAEFDKADANTTGVDAWLAAMTQGDEDEET